MFAAAASVMTAAISTRMRLERGPHGGDVVVRQDDDVAGGGGRHAGGVGQGEGGDARPGRRQQRVDMTVIAPGELDDLGASGEPAGQPRAPTWSPRYPRTPA